MTPESAQYTQPDRDTNWVEHEAKLAGRPSNNKSLFIKGAKTVFSVGLGLAAAFGITKPVDALVKHALDLDNVKPRSSESSMTKEYFTQTADTQEILGAVNNFGMGELRQVLVIPESPDNDLIPYFRDAIAKLEVPNVTDISTIVVEGASVRPANGNADKLLFSDQINKPDFGLFAVISDVDGNKHIIGGISNGYLTGLKLVPDESVVALDLVIQDGKYGIVTSNGFLPIFDTNSDNTLNANSIDASTEFVAYNGEAVAVGPVAVVTTTAAPDLNSDSLNPISQEFLDFQSQVAANGMENTVGNDGVIRNGKGVEYLGINANLTTGEITIMVNGVPVVIDADKVSITDNGISVDGYNYDGASGNFTEGFNLESWASTTEHGAEFVSNLDLWNVPQDIQDSIKCEGNLCYDADGNVIFDASTGQYGLDFLQEALSTWGGVGGPQQKPDPRASRKNYPYLDGPIPAFTVKLTKDFRTQFLEVTGTDSRLTGDPSNGKIERILVGEKSWIVAIGEKMSDGKVVYSHVAYRAIGDEVGTYWIPILPSITGDLDEIWDDEVEL